jgi:ABC-type phosphate transport system substrate-binding protein
MNRRTLALCTLLASLFLGHCPIARAGGDEIVVIVNKDTGVRALSKSQLDGLFKRRVTTFPGGEAASPVDLPTDNPARRQFSKAALGIDPEDVQRYWIDQKIRSGMSPPMKLPSPAAVATFVGGNKAAIGYLPASAAQGNVKVVARIREGAVVGP